MAVVRPFAALRPIPDLVEQVAALPYDVVDSEEARHLVKDNPHSFLHVDKAEVDLPPHIDIHDEAVYAQARKNLETMRNTGVFLEDPQACFYIYRQIMDQRSQTGLVCCTAVDDYLQNVIKKHEHTLPSKEQDRVDHILACQAHTGPIFQAYRRQDAIDAVVNSWMADHDPLYQFCSEDQVEHIVWVVDDAAVIAYLESLFAALDYLYVADGHHRSAAATRVGERKRQENPQYTGEEEFNFFLSVLFPASDLQIMGYHRVVKDLHGLTKAEFLARLDEQFVVESLGDRAYQPTQKREYGMCLEGTWFRLAPHPALVPDEDPVASLDVSLLQDLLLQPLLGIADPRNDARMAFVGGIRGLASLERRVQDGWQVAFALYPTSMEEVMTVADANLVMPPKSTWFEPKLRSGVFVHSF